MIRGLLLLALCAVITATNEECIENGVVGRCVNFGKCQAALSELKKYGTIPKICRYKEFEPIVCCFEPNQTSTAPTLNDRSLPHIVTTVKYDYNDDVEENTCKPIDPELTAPRTGQKAWDKCLEYQERFVYPCEKSDGLSLNAGWKRRTKCLNNVDGLIVGGTNARKNQFSHMALLGYGNISGNDIQWLCGGSLISDNFILTAGHCLVSRTYGVVRFAYIGALSRSEIRNNSNKQYRIKNIIKHPNYQSPNKYNDIALLELDRRVILSEVMVPACLPVGDFKDYKAIATGWGLTAYEGSTSNILQMVNLTKFTPSECSENFPPDEYMPKGYDLASQMCYGDKIVAKDTCQGDSGGPLQIIHDKIKCMYVIIGITSAGYACGFEGQPGLYTRVSHYVPWIESVVWP